MRKQITLTRSEVEDVLMEYIGDKYPDLDPKFVNIGYTRVRLGHGTIAQSNLLEATVVCKVI